MSINKPNLPNTTILNDDKVQLTTGSQLYPGTFVTADSFMSKTKAFERQLNKNIRNQRYNQLLSSMQNRQQVPTYTNRYVNRYNNPIRKPNRKISQSRQTIALAA